MGDDDNTQLICSTEPNCLCTGDADECDCDEGEGGSWCVNCGAALKRIDFNTAEEISA